MILECLLQLILNGVLIGSTLRQVVIKGGRPLIVDTIGLVRSSKGTNSCSRRWDHVWVAVYIRNDLSIRSPEVGTYANDHLLDGAVYPVWT